MLQDSPLQGIPGLSPPSDVVPVFVPEQLKANPPKIGGSDDEEDQRVSNRRQRRLAIDTKVLHLVNGEHFSGAERVQSHLGRCLREFGVEADFACVKPGKFAEVLREHGRDWGRCHDAEMASRFDLRAALRVRTLARVYGYDLLHAHTPRTAMIASAASFLSGLPWVYHVHSPASRDSANRVGNMINGWVERWSLSGCSHLITVSNSLKRDCLEQGYFDDQVTVVHNGVPTIRPQRLRAPSPGGTWKLGMIALMRPRKGLEVVLDALAHLRNEGHLITLRCIGPFETETYRHEIELRISQLGLEKQIEWVGFTNDVPAELAKIDAMVLPSLYGEGLPMVVLEAMAAAVPVIATRVEGTPEAISDGIEGLLAEPQDPISLSDRIRSLVTGVYPWQPMAEAAFDRQRAKFSDRSMAWGTANVYRKLLGKKKLKFPKVKALEVA